jgi:hypothetical protein
MNLYNTTNIKALPPVEQILPGNFLVVEDTVGTKKLNFNDFVIGPNNTSFYTPLDTRIKTLSTSLISLSSETVALSSTLYSTGLFVIALSAKTDITTQSLSSDVASLSSDFASLSSNFASLSSNVFSYFSTQITSLSETVLSLSATIIAISKPKVGLLTLSPPFSAGEVTVVLSTPSVVTSNVLVTSDTYYKGMGWRLTYKQPEGDCCYSYTLGVSTAQVAKSTDIFNYRISLI